MILVGTKLKIKDNSGAYLVKCIGVKKKMKKSKAILGDYVLVSIKKRKGNKLNRRKKIYTSLIIGTKRKVSRKDGSSIRFNQNNSLLISEQHKLIGTRILAPVAKELALSRTIDNNQVISKAPRLI